MECLFSVLEDGAIIKEAVALHVSIGHFDDSTSISTQISRLRQLLLDGLQVDDEDLESDYFAQAAQGRIPLVVNAAKADQIATIIRLKAEVEKVAGNEERLGWIVYVFASWILAPRSAHSYCSLIVALDTEVKKLISSPRNWLPPKSQLSLILLEVSLVLGIHAEGTLAFPPISRSCFVDI